MEDLLAAILADNRLRVGKLLKANKQLAIETIPAARLYESPISHWIYAGDTALHLAAAGHRVEIVQRLIAAGADPNAAQNHRCSGPLHYAADGCITGPDSDAERQASTIEVLLAAGATINAPDKNGATPLHRAVRHRCAAAVKCLLQAGADPTLKNKPGSTPFHLAVQNTGCSGSGEELARAAQRQIIAEFLARGIDASQKDGRGKTVLECARTDWVRELLT